MKRLPLLSLLALVFVAPFLGSCGGGESPGGPDPQPSSTPTPANSVRSILIPNFGFVLAPDVASFQNIDFPPVGNIDVTIDWGGGSQVNLYVAESSCASFTDIRQGRCSVLARDDSPSKPKVVRFNSVAGRVYSIWVHNSGAARETVSGLVGITTAGPLPSPSATPSTGDPQGGLAPGPVTRVTLYIYQQYHGGRPTQGGTIEQKTQDSEGRWILHVDDFVVFDSTQRNVSGEICRYINPPDYRLDDPQDVLNVRDSSNLFNMRADVLKKGQFELVSSVDGIDSGVLKGIVP